MIWNSGCTRPSSCWSTDARRARPRSARPSWSVIRAADLAHLCDSAAEFALSDSVRSGQARPVRMGDLERSLREVRPSTTAWLEDARNVVMFANQGGRFDDLLAYLKQRRSLGSPGLRGHRRGVRLPGPPPLDRPPAQPGPDSTRYGRRFSLRRF